MLTNVNTAIPSLTSFLLQALASTGLGPACGMLTFGNVPWSPINVRRWLERADKAAAHHWKLEAGKARNGFRVQGCTPCVPGLRGSPHSWRFVPIRGLGVRVLSAFIHGWGMEAGRAETSGGAPWMGR